AAMQAPEGHRSVAAMASLEATSESSVDRNAATRTIAPTQALCRLRILDAADFGPLRDSRARLIAADQTTHELACDATGHITLPIAIEHDVPKGEACA